MSYAELVPRESNVLDRPDLVALNAAKAAAEAIEETLSDGIPVTYAEDGIIYREHCDGRREVIGAVGDDADDS